MPLTGRSLVFCNGGGHYCDCQRRELCRGENFQIWRLRNAFSALVMRCVSEESTSNKCEKAGIFSAYKCLFRRSC